jgi:methionine-rich copper-binding protein CopC
MTVRSFLLTIAAVVILCQPPAFADAKLVSSTPPAGATVRTAPARISMTFSERVNAPFCTILVLDERDQRVQQGYVEATSYGSKTVTIAVKPLTAGIYKVSGPPSRPMVRRSRENTNSPLAPDGSSLAVRPAGARSRLALFIQQVAGSTVSGVSEPL